MNSNAKRAVQKRLEIKKEIEHGSLQLEIKDAIRQFMRENSITFGKVAEKLNCHRRMVHYLLEKRHETKLSSLCKLLCVLNVKLTFKLEPLEMHNEKRFKQ